MAKQTTAAHIEISSLGHLLMLAYGSPLMARESLQSAIATDMMLLVARAMRGQNSYITFCVFHWISQGCNTVYIVELALNYISSYVIACPVAMHTLRTSDDITKLFLMSPALKLVLHYGHWLQINYVITSAAMVTRIMIVTPTIAAITTNPTILMIMMIILAALLTMTDVYTIRWQIITCIILRSTLFHVMSCNRLHKYIGGNTICVIDILVVLVPGALGCPLWGRSACWPLMVYRIRIIGGTWLRTNFSASAMERSTCRIEKTQTASTEYSQPQPYNQPSSSNNLRNNHHQWNFSADPLTKMIAKMCTQHACKLETIVSTLPGMSPSWTCQLPPPHMLLP